MGLEHNVLLPEKSGIYKVGQFTVDGKPYLRFGSACEYHKVIVKNFADEIGIPVEIDDSKGYPLTVLPNDKKYDINGMGWCSLNLEQKAATFYKSSSDYLIGINREHLEAVKLYIPELQISIKKPNKADVIL